MMGDIVAFPQRAPRSRMEAVLAAFDALPWRAIGRDQPGWEIGQDIALRGVADEETYGRYELVDGAPAFNAYVFPLTFEPEEWAPLSEEDLARLRGR